MIKFNMSRWEAIDYLLESYNDNDKLKASIWGFPTRYEASITDDITAGTPIEGPFEISSEGKEGLKQLKDKLKEIGSAHPELQVLYVWVYHKDDLPQELERYHDDLITNPYYKNIKKPIQMIVDNLENALFDIDAPGDLYPYDLRPKLTEMHKSSRNNIAIDWVTAEDFSDGDIDSLVDAIKSEISEVMDDEGITSQQLPSNFNVTLRIRSRQRGSKDFRRFTI